MKAVNIVAAYKSGKGRKGVRIVGQNKNGMTDTFYTDKHGHVCVKWTSNTNRLTHLYVSGKKYKGPFFAGNTYAFSL